jgi:hypothetical protein
METQEIVKLTRETVAELVKLRGQCNEAAVFKGTDRRRSEGRDHQYPKGSDRRRSDASGRRRSPARWPFPGMIELTPVGDDGGKPWFATCTDLNLGGLGLMADRSLSVGTVVEFACHLPEKTIFGRATIRHCTKTPKGYKVGIEFIFDG